NCSDSVWVAVNISAGGLACGPTDGFVSPDRALNGCQLALFVRTRGEALEIIRALHQHGVELVSDVRCDGCRITGRMDPVVAGERIAELLELPDGCNALFVDVRAAKALRPSSKAPTLPSGAA